jgi:DNA-binding transcriptional LysR family regulator
MEINRLRQFATLARTCHLRKSAEILKMSPGALSKSLKVLEDSIGLKLFEAQGRGLAITETGKEIFKYSQRVLEEFEILTKIIHTKSTNIAQPRIIRLASFELFSTHVFGQVMSAFPLDCQFHVLEKAPGEIEKSILKREADFGVTTSPIPDPSLDFLKICQFKIGIFVNKNLAKTIDISQIPFSAPITLISKNPSGETQLDGWPANKIRRVLFQCEALETGLALARTGHAAIYCPHFIAMIQNKTQKKEFHLSEIVPPSGFKTKVGSIYFVKRKTDPESAIVKKLITQLRLLCKNSS